MTDEIPKSDLETPTAIEKIDHAELVADSDDALPKSHAQLDVPEGDTTTVTSQIGGDQSDGPGRRGCLALAAAFIAIVAIALRRRRG
jgi:hypothetical protein